MQQTFLDNCSKDPTPTMMYKEWCLGCSETTAMKWIFLAVTAVFVTQIQNCKDKCLFQRLKWELKRLSADFIIKSQFTTKKLSCCSYNTTYSCRWRWRSRCRKDNNWFTGRITMQYNLWNWQQRSATLHTRGSSAAQNVTAAAVHLLQYTQMHNANNWNYFTNSYFV